MCLNAGAMGRIDAESETLIPIGGSFDVADVAPTLNAGANSTGGNRQPGMSVDTAESLVVHALRGDGFDASEDGTGRGTPLVPIAFAIGSHAGCAEGDQTNRSHTKGGPVGMGISEEKAHTVRAGRAQTVAFGYANTAGDTDLGIREEQAAPITTRHSDPGMVLSVALRGREGGGTAELGGETATALRASQGGGDKPHALFRSGVRRLMPVECERLQGFSDGYTAITYRGKPAADGPRYKAIGNSMAVPVIRWILQRIDWLDANVPEVIPDFPQTRREKDE